VSAARTYEASAARVEEIIRRLDAGEVGLSETLELVREGKDLIEHCARELEAVGDALEELRLEDLVARLERDGGGGRDTQGAGGGGRGVPTAGGGGRDAPGAGGGGDETGAAPGGERAR
jgi:exodeoxyribonuclease VII small subunit